MTLNKQERWALAVGMLGLVSTFGIARFIYTPLLPLMQTQLGFGEDWAGLLASANYVGYLCGALIAMFIHTIDTKRRLFRLAIVLAALSNIGMGISLHDTTQLFLRFFSGLASAGGMVIGSGLMMLAINPRHSSTALSIHFAGIGLGIVLGALWVLGLQHFQSWQGLWISSGILILLLGLPGLLFSPWQLHPHKQVAIDTAVPHKAFKWLISLIALAYFCEGVGYVISATFLVSILQKGTLLPHLGDYAWVVVGLAAAPSCWLWAQLAQRIGEFRALTLAYLVQAVGVVLPVISTSEVAAMLGALLFGGTFMGIVSMVLMYGGKLGGSRPTRLMGLLTACFGVAQIIGPAVAGWIAEQQGNFNLPLILASAITVTGGILMWVAHYVAKQGMEA